MMNNYQYYNYQNDMLISNNTNVSNNNLVDCYTGFMRGNMFNNLYDPYKNYKPIELNPKNEQEEALLLVQMYNFCAHELTLYLDNYPDDNNMIQIRDKYVNAAKEATKQYEMKYGPLSLESSTLNTTPWAWDSKKWPWEGNY